MLKKKSNIKKWLSELYKIENNEIVEKKMFDNVDECLKFHKMH